MSRSNTERKTDKWNRLNLQRERGKEKTEIKGKDNGREDSGRKEMDAGKGGIKGKGKG